jgi:hypothetical protein
MKIVLRTVAVLFVAVALFLLYAVIHALGSEGGARPGVAVGYVIGSALLIWAAVAMWRRKGADPAAPAVR